MKQVICFMCKGTGSKTKNYADVLLHEYNRCPACYGAGSFIGNEEAKKKEVIWEQIIMLKKENLE